MADKDLIARPRRQKGFELPSLESVFPRTLQTSRMSGAAADLAASKGDKIGSTAESMRGILAGGLVALPADIAGAVSNVVPQGAKDWLTGRAALDFGKALVGGASSLRTPQPPAATAPAAPDAPAPPVEGTVLPARRPDMQSASQAALINLLQPRQAAAAPQVAGITPAAEPVLPAPVDRTPRRSAIEGLPMPVLPSKPTFGDLMGFRLNALQTRSQALPGAAREKQTRQAEAEGRAEDELGLKRFDLKRLTRQGDQKNTIDALDSIRRQGSADRSADISERRLQLGVLKELRGGESKFKELLEERQAQEDYLTQFWPHGQELGQEAFAIAEQTGIPMDNLSDILAEEIADAEQAQGTVKLDNPNNIKQLAARLRKRVSEAR